MDKQTPKRLSLLRFLRNSVTQARQSLISSNHRPVFVLGNPSADLDSIISAIIYSYFATTTKNQSINGLYIPLINLIDIPAGKELRRLRPEFATSLQLATDESTTSSDNRYDASSLLAECILTTADLKEELSRERKRETHRPISDDGSNRSPTTTQELDVFMVDWNALPVTRFNGRGIGGISDEFEDIQVSVHGCIDHHEDEGFIPDHPTDRVQHRSDKTILETRCIQTGVGSCTSLVVRELRQQGLWIDGSASVAPDEVQPIPNTGQRIEHTANEDTECESQVAKLALAAILADTANMTAESKVSTVDREAVAFLEMKISHSRISWDRQGFYNEIMEAKSSSVDYLTMDEILGRDYKEWVDSQSSVTTTSSKSANGGRNIKIGICNIVKPFSWVFKKALSDHEAPLAAGNGIELFLQSLDAFSNSQELDIVAVMTVYTIGPENDFHRELLLRVIDNQHLPKIEEFTKTATEKLRLMEWRFDGESGNEPDSSVWGKNTRLWRQDDISKSRKQVAPLLRKIFTG
ncbi:Exopolyphosphatase [Myotisia sp. PD_48]|nr:Exopolyphosphatase [Myotisia sp. PD_48]